MSRASRLIFKVGMDQSRSQRKVPNKTDGTRQAVTAMTRRGRFDFLHAFAEKSCG